MLLRSATLLVLVALAAGCDSADPAPNMFEATFQEGDVQQTVTGAYGYTLLSRYTGLGTGDGFSVQMRTEPSPTGSFIWYELLDPEAVDGVTLHFGDAAVPEGTYQIEGQPWAGASFNLNGQRYFARSGTVTVDHQRGRLVGTFRLTDAYGVRSPSNVQVEGRFEVETGL